MKLRYGLIFDLLILVVTLSYALFSAYDFVVQMEKEQNTMTAPAVNVQSSGQGFVHVDEKMIVDSDLMGTKPASKPVEKPPVKIQEPPPKPIIKPVAPPIVKTDLQLELNGVILDAQNSVAFIYNKTKRESRSFFVDEEVIPGVILVEIHLHHVILLQRGQKIELVEKGYEDLLSKLLGEGATFASAGADSGIVPSEGKVQNNYEVSHVGGNVFVTQKEVQKQVKHLQSLLSQVRVQPNFSRSGRAEGFKILHVNRGSFVESLGIVPGDIILSINGEPISSMKQGYELFNRLQNEIAVDVEIVRSGENKKIHFEMRY